jgi:L-lactate dehydrogenase complex protein LldG
VAVVRATDVVPDMAAGFDRLAGAFAAGATDAVLVTGPSATADMGALVQGVHGPAEMHVVIVDR